MSGRLLQQGRGTAGSLHWAAGRAVRYLCSSQALVRAVQFPSP